MSAQEPPRPHIPYKVGTPEKTETFGANGLEVIWHIPYTGPNNSKGWVNIPDHDYTPAEVDRRIEAELDKVVGVLALGPQPHPENAA